MFQFHSGSIKSIITWRPSCLETGFNSTLVRLKDILKNYVDLDDKSFNSTLVRIFGYSNMLSKNKLAISYF